MTVDVNRARRCVNAESGELSENLLTWWGLGLLYASPSKASNHVQILITLLPLTTL